MYQLNDSNQIVHLETYLHPDPQGQNIRNLKSLMELYSKDRTVSFIGAGVSKPLGIPDWEQLLNNLSKCANKYYNFQSQLPQNSKEWPAFAEKIYNEFNQNNNSQKYFEIVSERMKPQINTTTLTLVKLVLAINIHLTTNFDSSIENAYKFLNYLSEYFGESEMRIDYRTYYIPDFSFDTGSNPAIYYLHGNVEKNIYILKKSDYEKFYPSVSSITNSSKALEEFLKYYYKNKNIIFIGFSFQDYYIREFFLNLAKEIERENQIHMNLYRQSGGSYAIPEIKHFLIIGSGTSEFRKFGDEIFNNYQSFNIYPIIYHNEQHIFLEKLFEELCRGRI